MPLLEKEPKVSHQSLSASSKASTPKRPKRRKILTINLTNTKYDVVKETALKFGFKSVEDPKKWSLFWIDTGVALERIIDM
jgi:hypothetical protein